MMTYINETFIEEADIQFYEEKLNYQHINAWEKKLVGRNRLKDVVLVDRLRTKLEDLNPIHKTKTTIDEAIQQLTKSRTSLSLLMANKEVYELIKKGVPVTYTNEDGREESDYIKVIDFDEPHKNDFLVVSQLSIEYLQTKGITRRPDLLLYVNGLPLVMIELKNSSVKVKSGYDVNLQRYKKDIPQLFWYNLFVCISNGIYTRVGSFNAP